jgi:hypothetical protein
MLDARYNIQDLYNFLSSIQKPVSSIISVVKSNGAISATEQRMTSNQWQMTKNDKDLNYG